MSETPRVRLPFILPGQAQKELYHNEALTIIDMALQASVEEEPRADPPPQPLPGRGWIVAADATGDWAGHTGSLAFWTEFGWRYLIPPAGMSVWVKSLGHWIHYDGSSWNVTGMPAASLLVEGKQVVGARQPSITTPSGGSVIDLEARAAVSAIIATLMSHGLIDG